jgi:cytochrome c biogenesis protein CcmG, thiol:disulfide interchange protein DsbE
MRRLLFVVPVVAAGLLAMLFYVSLSGPPPSELPSPLVGKPAPIFILPALAGAQGFTRGDLAQGHATLVNFWASWCAPCRVEHPLLAALAAQKNIALYGMAWKNKPGQARAFLDELGNPFTRIDVDENGRASIDWGVTGVPETFVVDGNGIIRAHYAGPLTPEVLSQIILPGLTGSAAR